MENHFIQKVVNLVIISICILALIANSLMFKEIEIYKFIVNILTNIIFILIYVMLLKDHNIARIIQVGSIFLVSYLYIYINKEIDSVSAVCLICANLLAWKYNISKFNYLITIISYVIYLIVQTAVFNQITSFDKIMMIVNSSFIYMIMIILIICIRQEGE